MIVGMLMVSQGFAKSLDAVSKPTAQRIKRSGVIKDAITQYGRTIVIDRQKALELAREADNKRKGGRRCKK